MQPPKQYYEFSPDGGIHYESLPEYIEYSNKRRRHCSLDIANYKTSLKAFCTGKAAEKVRSNDSNWREAESNDRWN